MACCRNSTQGVFYANTPINPLILEKIMAKIGFVGLGHMGLPMATNLLNAGHEVTAYDLQASVLEQFKQIGGMIASSLKEVGHESNVIITMVQKGQQVLQLCQDGLLKQALPGALFIDCSTIDVKTSVAVHQLAKEYGLLSVDAPVSGGVTGASTATLTFMVGGDDSAFEVAKPILAQMGQKIIHTGPAGSGQAAKICNNMILGISMVAISEAFTLAKELHLAPEKLFEVVSNSSGQCWAMTKYVPVPGILDNVPANNNFKPGFTAAMMLKDLKLSQDSAQHAGVNTILGAKTTELYQLLIDQGLGEVDFSAIIQQIAQTQEVIT